MRTKKWWSVYNKEESWFIWNYERSQNHYYRHDGYLPDDCSECSCCGDPMFGSGICNSCNNEYDKLLNKQSGQLDTPVSL